MELKLGKIEKSTLRVFAEYADPNQLLVDGRSPYSKYFLQHHIYGEGYRYRGRPIGHWADQDSQIISIGGILQRLDGIGWGATLRTGKLNEDGSGRNSVSDNTSTDYFSFDIFNARQYPQYDLSVHTSLGWESLQPQGTPKMIR